MTKEEAKTILQCRGNGYSEDEFNEALEIAYFALDSSLLSNLDEAAEEYADIQNKNFLRPEIVKNIFRAGAEWMAGQFQQEQPEADLELEIERIVKNEEKFMKFQVRHQLIAYVARHFYELGKNARKEE